MPKKGQVLYNADSGNSYEFVATAADTKGQRVTMIHTINSKGREVPNHIHVLQEETFSVISGKLTVWVDGNTKTVEAGESITLPKGKAHNHYNNHEEHAIYTHTISPALDFDYFIESLVGLTSDGKSKKGKYGLIQELVFSKYLDSKTYLADKPVALQKALVNIVAPIGRMMGYRAIYKKYSGIEK